MSWVLASCGEASVVPLSCDGLVIEALVTRPAPPEAAPAMMAMAPWDEE